MTSGRQTSRFSISGNLPELRTPVTITAEVAPTPSQIIRSSLWWSFSNKECQATAFTVHITTTREIFREMVDISVAILSHLCQVKITPAILILVILQVNRQVPEKVKNNFCHQNIFRCSCVLIILMAPASDLYNACNSGRHRPESKLLIPKWRLFAIMAILAIIYSVSSYSTATLPAYDMHKTNTILLLLLPSSP